MGRKFAGTNTQPLANAYAATAASKSSIRSPLRSSADLMAPKASLTSSVQAARWISFCSRGTRGPRTRGSARLTLRSLWIVFDVEHAAPSESARDWRPSSSSVKLTDVEVRRMVRAT